jgi:hypothetical protein
LAALTRRSQSERVPSARHTNRRTSGSERRRHTRSSSSLERGHAPGLDPVGLIARRTRWPFQPVVARDRREPPRDWLWRRLTRTVRRGKLQFSRSSFQLLPIASSRLCYVCAVSHVAPRMEIDPRPWTSSFGVRSSENGESSRFGRGAAGARRVGDRGSRLARQRSLRSRRLSSSFIASEAMSCMRMRLSSRGKTMCVFEFSVRSSKQLLASTSAKWTNTKITLEQRPGSSVRAQNRDSASSFWCTAYRLDKKDEYGWTVLALSIGAPWTSLRTV